MVISIICAFIVIGMLSSLLLFDRHVTSEKYRNYISQLQEENKQIEAKYEKQLAEVKYEKEILYADLITKIDNLSKNNNVLTQEITNLNKQIDSIHIVNKPIVYTVSASHYTASRDETDSTPHITATGSKPTVGRTIAVSADLFQRLRGKQVYIPGRGIFTVEDRMNDRFKMKVDVLVASKTEARQKGVEHDLKMMVLPTL